MCIYNELIQEDIELGIEKSIVGAYNKGYDVPELCITLVRMNKKLELFY